jgi:hypothetical protein
LIKQLRSTLYMKRSGFRVSGPSNLDASASRREPAPKRLHASANHDVRAPNGPAPTHGGAQPDPTSNNPASKPNPDALPE